MRAMKLGQGRATVAGARSPASACMPLTTLAVACSALWGCAAEIGDSGEAQEVAVVASALTGSMVARDSAESQLAFDSDTFVVAYNGPDPDHVTYSPTDRFVYSGAAGIGYSPCGWPGCFQARPTTPPGFPVLWGDPGLAMRKSGGVTYHYMTSIAVPQAKMPGFIQGGMTNSTLPASYGGSYIGALCVGRSTNGGASFSFAAADCLQKITTAHPHGVFYDGSSVAAGSRIYVSARDVSNNAIEVYMATSPTGAFKKLPTPFSSFWMKSHPRLVLDAISNVYVMARRDSGDLLVSKYTGGTSYTGSWTTPLVVASNTTESDVQLSDRTLRTGPDFSFAIGLNEAGNGTDLRAVYTVEVNGVHHVRGAKCAASLTSACSNFNTWSTTSWASDQFAPLIAQHNAGPQGSKLGVWRISFTSRHNFPTGNKVEIMSGNFGLSASGSPVFSWARLAGAQVPCVDNRGYWGDYEDLEWSPAAASFGRSYVDTTGGTCTRWQYKGTPQDVRLVYFN
jgi:hypothetical protein